MGGGEFAQVFGHVRWGNVGRCSARDESGGGRLWDVVIGAIFRGSHHGSLGMLADGFMGFPV